MVEELMLPEFLITEFQALLRPLELLLTSVNRFWGLGASLLLPALVFWLGGCERGFRAAWITALSGSLNTLFKWALAMPRPFYVSDRFTPLKLTDGYGMPSGNAQGPATLLLALAKNGPRWIWVVGVPLVLLAGVARIYYGVHSVNQVLVGWGLGIAIAILAMAAERPLVDAAKRLGSRQRIGALLLLAGIVFLLWHAVAMWSIHQKPPPAEWAERFAELQVELDEQDEPYSLVVPAEAGDITGLLLGFGLVALAFLSRGWPRLERPRERLIAVGIGIPTYFLWSKGAGVVITGLVAVSKGLVFSLLLIPPVATLPVTLFLVVPVVAQRLTRRRER
ncbi:MAG: phosphatase PAP2 family protein [Acidobacteriota bacterium]|nr:phosphatase PAP2 family protein [Acidobacteriota bacterium]